MKNKTLVLFSAILSMSLGGCALFDSSKDEGKSNNAPTQDVPKTGQGYLKVKLRDNAMVDKNYLFVGENGYNFDAPGKFDDGTSANYTYQATWESSNPEVLVIGYGGSAKALSNGKATVTATYGAYTDSLEVVVKTYAQYHYTEDVESLYRTNRSYAIPIHVTPSNAFVTLSCDDPDAFENTEDNKFIPKKAGNFEVTCKVYTGEDGRARTYPFTFNVVENEKPYFKYKDNIVEEASLDVAVYKYHEINFEELGISAFKGDTDEEITSSVYVKSGTYALNEIGEYTLTLGVLNQGVEGTMQLKLNIIEKEEVIYNLGTISLPVNSYSCTVSSTNLRVASFSVSTYISGYEKYTGSIFCNVKARAKQNVSGSQIDLDKSDSKSLSRSPAGYYTVSWQYTHNTDMRAGSEHMTLISAFATFTGYGYNYIAYEPW